MCGHWVFGTWPVQIKMHCVWKIHTQFQRLSTSENVTYFSNFFYNDYMWNDNSLYNIGLKKALELTSSVSFHLLMWLLKNFKLHMRVLYKEEKVSIPLDKHGGGLYTHITSALPPSLWHLTMVFRMENDSVIGMGFPLWWLKRSGTR